MTLVIALAVAAAQAHRIAALILIVAEAAIAATVDTVNFGQHLTPVNEPAVTGRAIASTAGAFVYIGISFYFAQVVVETVDNVKPIDFVHVTQPSV